LPRKLRCWLLCEDREQERFFRPILERHFSRIRVEARKAHGGASFVLQNLKRLAQYIRRNHQEAVALLVVIDGDSTGREGRLEEIRAAAGLTGAAWEEHIGRCIPSRSVETWEMWLCGRHEVDETTSYKEAFHREVERRQMSSRQAVEAWFLHLTPEEQKIEEDKLPALFHGRKEVDRLRYFAKR
jgi:hypothetical protein